ncbi:fimbrial protein [Kluyvera intermedia]|jgi:type 1 fimbria pilin|uniref:fimbrial protein n=1 Tax=Kluyvera intermedia TaxID=61648 RepID=UPI00242D548B|nr:fimbrial protein [Kluyvera intermedia]WEJ85256.1 MAG: type 1 fimbrial protein [Kluyvera intermedia]
MNRSASFVTPLGLLWLTLPLFSVSVLAADVDYQGHGKVSMQGAIIDTPCAIKVDSRDQVIDLITLPLDQIISTGVGPSKTFSIHLENCALEPMLPNHPGWSHFRVTFDGAITDGSLFALRGEARGIGLEIMDAAGNRMQPGIATSEGPIQSGAMRLDYSLRLVGNHQKLRAGGYQTTVRFKLDYF